MATHFRRLCKSSRYLDRHCNMHIDSVPASAFWSLDDHVHLPGFFLSSRMTLFVSSLTTNEVQYQKASLYSVFRNGFYADWSNRVQYSLPSPEPMESNQVMERLHLALLPTFRWSHTLYSLDPKPRCAEKPQ